jgi:methanogenic corrinoid protein MtbC1
MEHTIKALEEAGVRDKVKIMIGGAPVTQAFSDQIGADGYASNAAAAAVRNWLKNSFLHNVGKLRRPEKMECATHTPFFGI